MTPSFPRSILAILFQLFLQKYLITLNTHQSYDKTAAIVTSVCF